MSNHKILDLRDQHIAIDSFRDRFEYRSPSAMCRRRPVRSPVSYYRGTEESPYRNRKSCSRRGRIGRNVERKLWRD